MRNKLLAKKVLCSVLAASVFGMAGSALAADSAYPVADANITADTEYTTNDTIKADITGTGNENVTIINSDDTKAIATIDANSGNLEIKDLDSLTILTKDTKTNKFNGILAEGGSKVIINNVKVVNIGTEDSPVLTEHQDQAIHALTGAVSMNVGELNIYTGCQGIMAQNYGHDGVNIEASGDVNINSRYQSVLAYGLNSAKNGGKAKVKINAKGTVNIVSTNVEDMTSAAVSLTNKSKQLDNEYTGQNGSEVVIYGEQGINIESSNYGVNAEAIGKNADSTFSLESENGNVVINSKNDGIYLSDNNENNIGGNIIANNVVISSETGAAVNSTNGNLTLAANTVDGSVILTGADVAVKANGDSQLTLGDDKKANNVIVNGRIEASNSAKISTTANSTLVVDAKYLAADNKNTFIKGDVNVGGNLKVTNAKTGDTLKFTDNKTLNGELTDKVISSNVLQNIVKGDGTFTVGTVSSAEAEKALAGAVITNVALQATEDNIDAITALFNGADQSQESKVAALNSVANMGELAGVNHGTYSMSNQMTDAVADHLSIATHSEQDNDIWAHYIHNKEDIDGMNLGGVDGNYEAQYNGIVIGSDLYKNGKTTAGIALSYADGNINGSNSVSSTKNEAEYYGASLYGRIDNGNSAILGDISYMHSDNDITQTNMGQEITASADADAFSIGIRAEQAYEAGAGKFVPYAGIRYMHLGAGDYSNSLGMEYNADDQNLWLLPVGVTYSAEVQSGDWTVKPIAEVGYVWTMGDRDTDQTVSLNGASDTFGFETADSGSFIGRLGIEAEKADVTYGLSYEYQKGDTVKANKWMANLTFSF